MAIQPETMIILVLGALAAAVALGVFLIRWILRINEQLALLKQIAEQLALLKQIAEQLARLNREDLVP